MVGLEGLSDEVRVGPTGERTVSGLYGGTGSLRETAPVGAVREPPSRQSRTSSSIETVAMETAVETRMALEVRAT